MSDVSREASVEGEAPVNPYSLLEAVNASSQSAHVAWLAFLGMSAYLLVAVAGVTHKDLLVANDVSLPILQVRLELTRFFLIVPAVMLFMHVALLVQLVVLARKSLEFDGALRMVEATDRRSHPLRLELNNFFLVQAIAGPERSWVVGALLHGLGWLTLAAVPLLALLYVQATFLPYHHAGITWAHRAVVLMDIVLLALTVAFLVRPEQSVRQALSKACRQAPVRSMLAVLGGGIGAVLACAVIVIPDDSPSGPAMDGVSGPAQLGSAHGPVLFGLIDRNLNVPDVDLIDGRTGGTGRWTLNLRERDLRYARLDRSRLSGADLTGANLNGASLIGAELSGVALGCVENRGLATTDGHDRAGCARGWGADFARARLVGATLEGMDLTGAYLAGADLADATLPHANLSGANLSAARFDKADLSDARLAGANLSTASFVGADLSNATLTGADLTKAVLRAAVLNSAALEGVSLRNADLEAATLFRARLFAADLTGARVRAASLKEGQVWLARIPEGAESALADFSGLDAKTPPQAEREALARSLPLAVAVDREDMIGRLRATDGDATSATAWGGLVRASEDETARAATVIGSLVPTGGRINGAESQPPTIQAGGLAAQLRISDRRARLTRHLADLACHPRAGDGTVATGIVRRALGPGFNADPGALLESFRRPECAGGRAVPAAVLERLAGVVEVLGAR